LKLSHLLALALLLSSCAPTPAPEAAAPAVIDATAVRQSVESAYAAAVASGDAAAVAALYTDDAVVRNPQGLRLEGKQQIQDAYQASFDQGAATITITPSSALAVGDAVVVEGTYAYTITPEGGQPIESRGEYLAVNKQIDGEWKIIRLLSKPPVPEM
jgi:uncharacterized protein (TIGR02246 family)